MILVGVSRTSKTPTCIYLAHRGVRAGNVPLVPGRPPPDKLFELKSALVVGLTVSPDRLMQIRRNRLLSLKENRESHLHRRGRGARRDRPGAAALRTPGLAGDRRHPPLGRGDRRGGDEPAARRPRPGGGARVSSTVVLASKSAARRAVLDGRGRCLSRPSAPASTRTPPRPSCWPSGATPRAGRRGPGRAEGACGLRGPRRAGDRRRPDAGSRRRGSTTRPRPSRRPASGCRSLRGKPHTAALGGGGGARAARRSGARPRARP